MKTRFLLFAILILTLSWNASLAQWTSLGSGITITPRTLGGISLVNDSVIWGFTWHPTAFVPVHEFTRTTDGGQTWHPGQLTGVEAEQFPIYLYALDGQTAWLATADEEDPISGRIYKTTDGGTSWAHQSTGFTGFNETPAGVYFWNENEGFAYGATCYSTFNDQIAIYTTADGGENWTKVVAPNMPAQLPGEGMCLWNFASFFSVVDETAWFGTSKGRVFKSSDKGLSWEVVASPFPSNKIITSVDFKDADTGIALGANPLVIQRTTDGGATWATLTPTLLPGSVAAQVEYIPGTSSTWMIVSSPTNYMISYDDGDTWQTHDSNTDVWSVEFLNATTGFAGSYTTNPTTASLFKWTGPTLDNRLFVNDNATGLNNGTSWANAFTDLQSALSIAEAGGQIWVAEGNYLPGNDPTATFLIDKNLHLYGGFAGTENTLTERGDPADHPTILFGDVNGDDVPGNFVLNRNDNSSHVVSIAESANGTMLDGFTISGGNGTPSSPPASNDLSPERGGGVASLASCSIKNCVFRDNSAFWGGAGCYARFGDEVHFENCSFEENSAPRGALNLAFCNDAQILNCQFVGNTASFGGAGLNLGNSNSVIRGCEFTNNLTPGGEGGAVFLWQNPQIEFPNPLMTIENCSFTGNQALYGGGISFNNFLPDGHLTVQGCSFDNNSSTSDGAGLSVYNGDTSPDLLSVTLTNNHFTNNATGGDGGGVYLFNLGKIALNGGTFTNNTATNNGSGLFVATYGNEVEAQMSNCQFTENTATNNGSGLYVAMYGTGVDVQMNNCQFTGNTATNFSAAADFWGTEGATGSVVVDSCHFENNTSAFSGALEMGNGYSGGASIDYLLTNSTFKNNEASEGGAAGFWNDPSSETNVTIENCWWENNAASSKGGAILFIPDNNFNATILRSTFINNQSPDGGAIESFVEAPLPTNASVTIENSLITEHPSTNAAISAEYLPNLHLLNCTIADNNAAALQLSDQSHLTLQNTILANPGFTEYKALTADVSVTSNGGNLVLDSSLNAVLTALDKPGTEPGFMSGTYEPSATSPLVNGGVNAGVTATTDLAGNDRIQQGIVDIGAFESPFLPTSVQEIIVGEIGLTPNPASHFLKMELPEPVSGPLEASLFDAQGKLVRTLVLDASQMVGLQGLAAGMYSLKVAAGQRLFIGKFIKQ